MNIKSLILGSAAALVAGGAAQAADLPVAEPVDYVKVCDAYGAGYFFIPGTDTCLKISGKVEFGIQNGFQNYNGIQGKSVNEVGYYVETTLAFDAKEETEFGTLAAHIEYDNDTNAGATGGSIAKGGKGMAFDKAYLQLGGLYAGLTDSIVDFNAGLYYDDFGIGHDDLQSIGYVAALGNGVTATVALEEYTSNTGGAGTTMPSLAARLAVSQGWGSANVAAAIYQSRYAAAAFSADLGYIVGAEASFNLMEGLTFGIAGGYENGYTNDGAGNLWSKWAVSGGFEYALADNMKIGIDAGYVDYDEAAYKTWGTSAQLTYYPVKNLEVGARVGYEKTDFDVGADWDDVAGKLYLKRTF
nr:porin [uncultured Cohaesibacter sp.]